jgi:hypothetical protein
LSPERRRAAKCADQQRDLGGFEIFHAINLVK